MKNNPLGFALIYFLLIACSNSSENELSIDSFNPSEAVVQNKSAKRGVSFKYNLLSDVDVLGKAISWSYNWGNTQDQMYDHVMDKNNIDFFPMAWNGINEELLREYISRHPDCEYILGYNEPNLIDQANMTPAQAAENWHEVKEIADELGLKIISPAVNYGTLEGYHDPIKWLDEFFTLVPLDEFSGIAIHSYMSNPNTVREYIKKFDKYKKPIWLTEFCAWDGVGAGFTATSQREFMCDMINYLEAEPLVERYAWFIPRGNGSEYSFPYMFLLKNSPTSELTELGQVFTQLSTQDKSIYYVEQQQIEAEHYSSISTATTVDKGQWVNGPKARITTDAPNETLELYNILSNQWLEYQIKVDRIKDFELLLRYASFVDSEVEILLNNTSLGSYSVKSTGEEFIWSTAKLPLDLPKGKHTLRLVVKKGMLNLNWLKF